MTGQPRVFQEELTSHERLEALLTGCTLDRVPCHPFIGDHAAECLRKAADSPKGFVLAVGCGMPIPAPQVNVHALMSVVREARWKP